MTWRAACCCGQLEIILHGPLTGVGLCHCKACQGRTGSAFATLASFDAPWEVRGTRKVYRRTGDQGAEFAFHFCPECGTSVFQTERGYEDGSIGVAVGALDGGRRSRPRSLSMTADGTLGYNSRPVSRPMPRTRSDAAGLLPRLGIGDQFFA